MAGQPVFPAEFGFFGGNELVHRKRGHGFVRVIPVQEEKSHGSAGIKPVLCKDIQRIGGKDGKAVGAVYEGHRW